MATTPFTLQAVLGLDSSAYDNGLNAAKNAGKAFGSGLANAAKVGLQAVTAATTAMVGLGAASVKVGATFDQSMSQVAATMGNVDNTVGASAEQMERLREKATELGVAFDETTSATELSNAVLRQFAQNEGRTTAFSATQAAEALNYMALAGYDAATSVDMLPNVLNLAAAGSIELARASDMVTDTQTAFGIDLARTTQLVDEMAKAASTGNTSVEQLGDAFLTVGGLAQELNQGFVTLDDGTQVAVDGIQELEIALTAMANAGIKGGEAGTHMRNMLLKLSSPTSDGTKALEEMGVAVFDAEGNMRALSEILTDLSGAMDNMSQEKRLQVISDLFNTRDLASAEALLNAVGDDWNEIGASIIDAEGAASAMAATQLDNLAGDITLFKSALEGAQIVISDKLTPSIRDFVKFGTNGLTRLTDAFQSGGLNEAMSVFGELLSEGLGMVVEMLPDFIDGGIQLLEALGKGIIDNLPTLTTVATKIISKLGTALSNNLPAIVRAGSDILSSLLTAINDNMDTIAPLITDFIVGFVQIMADNADEMVKITITIAGAIGEGLVQAAPIIAEAAPEIIGALTSALAKNPAAFVALAPKMLGFLLTGIKVAKPLISSIGKLLSSGLGETILSGLSSVGTAISGFFSSLVSSIGTFLTSTLGTVLTSVLASIAAFFAGAEIGKHIGSAIFPDDAELYEGYSGIMGTLNMLKDLFFAIIDFVKFAWEDFINGVKTDAANAWAFIQSVYGVIGEWFESVFNGAKILVTAVWDKIKTHFENVWNGIKLIYDVVKDWFELKFQAAKDAITSVWDTISEFFSGVWEDIKSALKISDAYQWGKDMLDNFAKGIKDNLGTVVGAVTGVSGTVSDYLHFSEPEKGPLSNFHTFAPDMIDLFTSGLEAGKSQLDKTLNDVFAMPDMSSVDVATNVGYNPNTVPAVAGVGAIDGTSIAAMISEALGGIVVEVNIGTEKLDDIITTSIQRTAYRSGGR